MKSFISLFAVSALLGFYLISCQSSDTPVSSNLDKDGDCNTIPGGEIYTSGGELITPGYMENGYNYQAHIYNGDYYGDGWNLVMKWNDAWLSNKDCGTQTGQAAYTDLYTPDGKLDRHYPLDSYIGSGAWCTNHWTTTYTDPSSGNTCEYDEFIKIVAVPVDAYLENNFWYNADGIEIGENIWGQFAIVQYVVNDPCEGVEGAQYISPDHPGLGGY